MVVLDILGVICSIIGVIGSIAPGIPGPPVSWVGVLLVYLGSNKVPATDPMSLTILLVLLAVAIIVQVIDYLVPIYFTKLTGGSKYAANGAIIGMVLGLFVPPIGMILGSIVGAFVAEIVWGRKSGWDSFKSALGSFAGFLAGTGIKLIACGVMAYYTIIYI